MTAATPPPTPTSDELADIATRLLRLSPSRTDPERFRLERDELAKRLRRVARRVEAGAS
jgi:hypothetical protein